MSIESALFLNCSVILPDGEPFVALRVSLACKDENSFKFEGMTDCYGQIWLWFPACHPDIGPIGIPCQDGSNWQVTFHLDASQYQFPSFSIDLKIGQGTDRSVFLLLTSNGYLVAQGDMALLAPLDATQIPGPLLKELPPSWPNTTFLSEDSGNKGVDTDSGQAAFNSES